MLDFINNIRHNTNVYSSLKSRQNKNSGTEILPSGSWSMEYGVTAGLHLLLYYGQMCSCDWQYTCFAFRNSWVRISTCAQVIVTEACRSLIARTFRKMLLSVCVVMVQGFGRWREVFSCVLVLRVGLVGDPERSVPNPTDGMILPLHIQLYSLMFIPGYLLYPIIWQRII
jgi:hypothetical protein